MSFIKYVLFLVLTLGFSLTAYSQNAADYTDDPELKKMLQAYQQKAQHVPAELLALIPPLVNATGTNYSHEQTRNAMITFSANENDYLKINFSAYNLKTDTGKMSAEYQLNPQKKELLKNWNDQHKELRKDFMIFSAPQEKKLPKGRMFIQKRFMDKHGDGEGDVPAQTFYAGFMIIEWEWGVLSAETDDTQKSQTEIEKWFRHISEKASGIKIEKLFDLP